MKLIIGGACQGKLSYACGLMGWTEEVFADGRTCAYDEIETCKGLNGFHEYIRRLLADGLDVSGLPEKILAKNPEIVLITNEVGYGVVPIDAFERQYRESCGRICCALAKEADEVHRVLCGIGTVIKP